MNSNNKDAEYWAKREANRKAVKKFRENEKQREKKEEEESMERQRKMAELTRDNTRIRGSIQQLNGRIGFMEEIFSLHGIQGDQWSHISRRNQDWVGGGLSSVSSDSLQSSSWTTDTSARQSQTGSWNTGFPSAASSSGDSGFYQNWN